MSRPKDSRPDQHTWPDSYTTARSIRPQLCHYSEAKDYTDAYIAQTCGACPVMCGYGKRWLVLYKAERQAEAERRQTAKERSAPKDEALALRRRQTWLYIALRPYCQRRGQ